MWYMDDATYLVHDTRRHAVIHLARHLDQAAFQRRSLNQKPWVYRDAMAADARTRAEDIDARMPVRQANRLPDIDAEALRDECELVGQCNVHIAKGVFHHFGHLRRCRVGTDDASFDEAGVQLGRSVSTALAQATGQAFVFHQLEEDPARKHPL